MTKSIRLNNKLREEILSNIEQAYTIKNPAPSYITTEEMRKEMDKKLTELCIARSNTLQAKATKAGIALNMLESRRYVDLCDTNPSNVDDKYLCRMYFTDSNDNYLYLNVAPTLDFFKDSEAGAIYKEYKKNIKGNKKAKDAHKAWELKKSNYLSDVRNVLQGVNTTGQLLEQWEEVEKFIPVGIVDPSSINLPSNVSIAQLNKLI